MKTFLSTAILFLMSLPVLAATEEMGKADVPAETVDIIYVVIFGVLFLGSIIGFFIYLFINEKKTKSDK